MYRWKILLLTYNNCCSTVILLGITVAVWMMTFCILNLMQSNSFHLNLIFKNINIYNSINVISYVKIVEMALGEIKIDVRFYPPAQTCKVQIQSVLKVLLGINWMVMTFALFLGCLYMAHFSWLHLCQRSLVDVWNICYCACFTLILLLVWSQP